MAYTFDIFLSYSRKSLNEQWVNEIFYPLFIPYVTEALGREIYVFKDTKKILTAFDWENTILFALSQSRIMVSVLSPSYFMSDWCQKEFKIMHYRQLQLGFMSEKNPSGIIVPIRLNDGDYFPEIVKKIQSLDLRNFFRIGDGFKCTPRFVEFQDNLLSWANDVAHAIVISPEWADEWGSKEWIKNSESSIDLNMKKYTNLPQL